MTGAHRALGLRSPRGSWSGGAGGGARSPAPLALPPGHLPGVPRSGHGHADDPEPDEERGVIVNTASIAAFDGQIRQVAYAASKGGVVSLTLPLGREFASFGVRVVCIAPGVFETPMVASMAGPVRAGLQNQQPFPKRFGDPAEFAALCCHIYENPMLNGAVMLRWGLEDECEIAHDPTPLEPLRGPCRKGQAHPFHRGPRRAGVSDYPRCTRARTFASARNI